MCKKVEGKINKGSTPVNPEASGGAVGASCDPTEIRFPSRYVWAGAAQDRDSASPIPRIRVRRCLCISRLRGPDHRALVRRPLGGADGGQASPVHRASGALGGFGRRSTRTVAGEPFPCRRWRNAGGAVRGATVRPRGLRADGATERCPCVRRTWQSCRWR